MTPAARRRAAATSPIERAAAPDGRGAAGAAERKEI
jgi:hypothetical protein